MSVSDAKRLKELEAENTRLKKLLAESLLQQEVVREVLRKKWSPPRTSERWCGGWRRGVCQGDARWTSCR